MIDAPIDKVRRATSRVLMDHGYATTVLGRTMAKFRTQVGNEAIELEIRLSERGTGTELQVFLFKIATIPAVGETREPYDVSSGALATTLEEIRQHSR